MKPAGWKWAPGLLALVALTGCSPERERAAPSSPEAASTWGRPPEVVEATLRGDSLTVSGLAQPGARVVFRQDDGDAHAVVADTTGRFVLPIVLDTESTLIRPEIQRGQETAAAPERLLVVRTAPAVIALLRNGRATRRLSPGPAVDSIDVSARSALVAGRSSSALAVHLGGKTETVQPRQGRWSRLISSDELARLSVDGRTYDWPGAAAVTGVAERAGQGWRIGWTDDAGARQTTWLPDS